MWEWVFVCGDNYQIIYVVLQKEKFLQVMDGFIG